MTQRHLERQIARATGESLATIRRLGFSIACPPLACFDPEPSTAVTDIDEGPNVLDWDEVDSQRMSIFPADYRRHVA